MNNNKKYLIALFAGFCFMLIMVGCNLPAATVRAEKRFTPDGYNTNTTDTTNIANIDWHVFFDDSNLASLIDTALKNNQELNIVLQEIAIRKNEIKARKGEYLPSIGLGAGGRIDKVGQFTRNGAVEENLNIRENTPFPDPLGDLQLGLNASWEVDIWKKLRNAKGAAEQRYFSSIEGKNFLVTQLVAEIASSYYELLALDNALSIVQQNIDLQTNALEMIKIQKESTRVSQLAVSRFEAQLLHTKNLQFELKQEITEKENYLNFLAGRFPQPITRTPAALMETAVSKYESGIPAQLIQNRTDVRSAENELEATKLDVKSAKAAFYPSLDIAAGIGYNAFNPEFLLNPSSIAYNIVGDIAAPLVNRNALKANFSNANARQMQAVFNYEQTLLQAYVDVMNELARIENYSNSFDTKNQEVEKLQESVVIANSLFNSARAEYTEVLFTQRDALDAKLELIEVKKNLVLGKVMLYKALGGGWR